MRQAGVVTRAMPQKEVIVQLKRIGITTIAALSLIGSTLAMSASAQAQHYRGHHHHGGWHRGGVGPGVALGVLGGALVAGAGSQYYGGARCWTERRPVYDAYGYRHWRRVQICG